MVIEVRQGQFLDDAQSLQALVDMMDDPDEYRTYGALLLEAGFPNRKVVVYTLKDKRPSNVEILTFGDIEMRRVGAGPALSMSDSKGELNVGMVPSRYRNRDLYFHLPQNFTFKWKGKQTSAGRVQFVPHYAVLIKMKSKEIHQVEGHTYCATLNKFRERFPDVDIRY
jgi:hypothetical protein